MLDFILSYKFNLSNFVELLIHYDNIFQDEIPSKPTVIYFFHVNLRD